MVKIQGEHQDECKIILESLDVKINPSPWIFGHQVSLLDISILPFIRQCKIANPEWFDAQQFNKVIGLLDYFEQDNLFIRAMQKYELWDPRSRKTEIFFHRFLKPNRIVAYSNSI